MDSPLVLDLFCGSGGAAAGYSRAGFRVVGVDHRSQPNYPFEFIRYDAIRFLELHGNNEADLIHASPPCQPFSRMARMAPTKQPDLVAAVRLALMNIFKPFVMENVEGAPLLAPVMLCGTMFGLKVRRHRLFELWPPLCVLTPDCQCRNGVVSGRLIGHRVGGRVGAGRRQPPRSTESDRRSALDCHWMTCREARQAIPPAYTAFLGGLIRQGLMK